MRSFLLTFLLFSEAVAQQLEASSELDSSPAHREHANTLLRGGGRELQAGCIYCACADCDALGTDPTTFATEVEFLTAMNLYADDKLASVTCYCECDVSCDLGGPNTITISNLQIECIEKTIEATRPDLNSLIGTFYTASTYWNLLNDGACHPAGGGGGDPHFKTWLGHRYDCYGECDLVLLHAPSFVGEILTYYV